MGNSEQVTKQTEVRHFGARMRNPEQVPKQAKIRHFGARMRNPEQVSKFAKIRHFGAVMRVRLFRQLSLRELYIPHSLHCVYIMSHFVGNSHVYCYYHFTQLHLYLSRVFRDNSHHHCICTKQLALINSSEKSLFGRQFQVLSSSVFLKADKL